MRCSYYDDARCRSCAWLPRPYAEQLEAKLQHCQALLSAHPDLAWEAPVASAGSGFRNKAKMVIGGSVEAPTLGLLDAKGKGVDLRDCPLYPPALTEAFPRVAEFLSRSRVVPYDVGARRGEGKFVLATLAEHSGELMLRFVLRSSEPLERMRKQLPWLESVLPGLRVASVNLQPVPMAVIEGEHEQLLGPGESLPMAVNGMVLHLRPRSFFQTNTAVAAALYAQARAWVEEVQPASVWDLYCGVGGFALHCTGSGRRVTGVESSSEAVASAMRSARELCIERGSPLRFFAADALEFVRQSVESPDLVIVNPPRRGLGAELAGLLDSGQARWLLYSSCNAESLARDLEAMPHFAARRARLFDMFPHTAHHEVLVLLERSPNEL